MRMLLTHSLIGLAFGLMFVVCVFPLNVLVFIAWIALADTMARLSSPSGVTRLKPIIAQVTIFATVTVLAFASPFKTQHEHLTKQVRLPKSDVTVSELQRITAQHGRCTLPVHVTFDYYGDLNDKLIHFEKVDLTLGEFITAVENQTPLRHRFAHCANGYTILWGYPPSFMLALNDKPD